jgi:dTDP-4-amino-4,6-dideoxygalactose transaminase
MSKDAWRRYERGGSWAYDVTAAGFKYNLSDVLAAIARAQLEREPEMRRRRAAIAAQYDTAFADLAPVVQAPPRRKADVHSWHLYVIRVRERDWFVRRLAESGVGASVHFIPVHLFSFYRERYHTRVGQFPHAEAAGATVLSLPIYSTMSETDVAFVIDRVRRVAAERPA